MEWKLHAQNERFYCRTKVNEYENEQQWNQTFIVNLSILWQWHNVSWATYTLYEDPMSHG